MSKRVKRRVVVRFREDRGMWEVDYRDQQGKRHRPLFETEEKALKRAASTVEELKRRLTAVDDRDPDLRLSEYIPQWLDQVRPELAAGTWQNYSELLRRYVLPTLGGLRLRDLPQRRREIKALLIGMRQRGYAGNYVRLVKAALSSMLTDATDDDLLDVNPVLQLGRTKKRRAGVVGPAERQRRIRPMTWEELDAFLAALAAEPFRFRVLLELMAKTGLRPGEACVLRLEDLDLVRSRTIRVERAWSRADARVKATKTYEHRTVELSAGVTRTLQRHAASLSVEALKGGAAAQKWLFPTATGQPVDEWQLGKAFRRACRHAGLEGFRPYGPSPHLRQRATVAGRAGE
jgi:integrase